MYWVGARGSAKSDPFIYAAYLTKLTWLSMNERTIEKPGGKEATQDGLIERQKTF